VAAVKDPTQLKVSLFVEDMGGVYRHRFVRTVDGAHYHHRVVIPREEAGKIVSTKPDQLRLVAVPLDTKAATSKVPRCR
jgi:hypothetical protein